jgi:hypothetical protein
MDKKARLMLIRDIYYLLKPMLPRYFQIVLRRKYVQKKRVACTAKWPIDEGAGDMPEGFPGWPEQKRFALVLTHDVETARGQEKCGELLKLEQDLGFKSSFSFVPQRYKISAELQRYLVNCGYEVVVHGLYHDGKLFKTKKIFKQRAVKINHYLKEWDADGFRSPSMHINLEWIHDLNIKYDSSTFDTDPFEPHPSEPHYIGMRTIFPFWVSNGYSDSGYVEIPYTLPQDFTLFVLMKEKNLDIWKRKLDWIVKKGGMALLLTHPDYMNFGDNKDGIEEYPAELYADFLNYIKETYKDQYWHVLPKDMAQFLKTTHFSGNGNNRGKGKKIISNL